MADSQSRWSVIVSYACVGAATQILWLTYAGVTTVAASHYGVSEAAIGWLAQVFPLLYVVLAIPAGLVLDRWFRGGLAAGAVLTAVGAVLRLVGDTYLWLLAGQIVVAVAQPLVLNALTGLTGRYLAQRHRPTGIAAGTAATFAGMVIAFVLAALFPGADGLATLTAGGAAFSAVAALALLLTLGRPVAHRHVAPSAGLSALRVAWSDGFIRRLCAFAFIPFGVFIALTTFAQALLAPAGVSAATASLILLVNVVAGVAGCAVVPVLAARFRKELGVLAGGLLVTSAAVATLAAAPGVAVGFLSLTLIGFVLLPGLPIALELTERRTGEAAGTATGLIWMAGNVGGLVIATVVGHLVHRPAPAFLLLAVLALLGLPAVSALREGVTADRQPAGRPLNPIS
ncbi:MFS transporter [Streptomyces boluensis]|uniref:MFS transporter n=1 Tax=Streptomyces boluensis TaxID=1775135 RepID=A0A964UL14_9ACTN|nr:MFS transporter [Streptomyces boluensis]NBE50491.1 MFS transporter [Streptomyces boluensis]